MDKLQLVKVNLKELHKYNIKCKKDDKNNEYINLNINRYDILNHKFRNYDQHYNNSNPRLTCIKNKYLNMNINDNWKLRKNKFKHSIIPFDKFDKVVFTFDPSIMDGGISKWSNAFNKTPNNYVPLIKCFVSNNPNYNPCKDNVNIHYKNIIIAGKKNNDSNGILLYLPLYESMNFTANFLP